MITIMISITSVVLLGNADGKVLTKVAGKKLTATNSSAMISVAAVSVRHCSYLCHSHSSCFSASFTQSSATCHMLEKNSYQAEDDNQTTALLPIRKLQSNI